MGNKWGWQRILGDAEKQGNIQDKSNSVLSRGGRGPKTLCILTAPTHFNSEVRLIPKMYATSAWALRSQVPCDSVPDWYMLLHLAFRDGKCMCSKLFGKLLKSWKYFKDYSCLEYMQREGGRARAHLIQLSEIFFGERTWTDYGTITYVHMRSAIVSCYPVIMLSSFYFHLEWI